VAVNIKSGYGTKGFPLFFSGGGIRNLQPGESIINISDE
jgi:hypothetical protein